MKPDQRMWAVEQAIKLVRNDVCADPGLIIDWAEQILGWVAPVRPVKPAYTPPDDVPSGSPALGDTAKVTVLPDGRLSRQDAATFLGREPKTLADWHSKGIGPRSRMVGGRRFYHIDDLKHFAAHKAA